MSNSQQPPNNPNQIPSAAKPPTSMREIVAEMKSDPAVSSTPPPRVMTNQSAIPSPPVFQPRERAPELADNIVAMPMVPPDFTHLTPANSNVAFRWVNFKAGDGLRYNQMLAMGWLNATDKDIKPGTLSPYKAEGGTKYINGDLILMKLDRNKYLGALKHKHLVAAALSDDSVQRAISARQAAASFTGARPGRISVFTPDAADLSQTPLGDSPDEVNRLGGTLDIGR